MNGDDPDVLQRCAGMDEGHYVTLDCSVHFIARGRIGIPLDADHVDAMRALYEKYPGDPDIATLFAEAFMNTSRWDYWAADGSPRPGTAEAQAALEAAMRIVAGSARSMGVIVEGM